MKIAYMCCILFLALPLQAQLRQNCDPFLEAIDAGEANITIFFQAASCLASNGRTDEAMEFLKMAAENGFHDLERLEGDHHLQRLKGDGAWQEIVALMTANQARMGSKNKALETLYEYAKKEHPPMAGAPSESVVKRDQERIIRAKAILKEQPAQSARDYFHGASLLVWSEDLEDLKTAHQWALKAWEMDSGLHEAKQLVCISEDKVLLKQKQPQVWGTQVHNVDGTWQLAAYDENAKTDEERRQWGQLNLEGLQRRVQALNQGR